MNTKKTKKSLWTVLFSILLILTIIAVGGGILAPNLAGKKDTAEAPENGSTITAEAATTITYPSDSSSHGLGQFPNGYTYYYTDKDLYLNYHNGSGTSDLTKVTVDTVTANNHGTKANPYVIADTADWGKFVTYVMSDTNSWGSGKFFALAGDLNFSSTTFRALGYFSGTFYGLGHIISNITTTFSNVGATVNAAAGTWGYGLFCRAYNATITDLVVKDFTYQNFTQGYNTHNSRGSAVGGVVGYASGNDYILNCHTNGTVQSTTTYTVHVPVGGIIGAAYNGQKYVANTSTTTTSTYIYRCSSELSVSIHTTTSENRVVIPGGMVGENYNCRNTTYIFDCAANVTVPDSTGSYGVYASVGNAITGNGANVYIDGLVGRVEFTLSSAARAKHAFGGAATGVFASTVKASMTLKNVYVEGAIKSGTTTTYMGAACGDTTVANLTRTLSQVYHTSGITGGVDKYASYDTGSVNQTAESGKVASLTDLLTKARGAVGTGSTKLNEKIWNSSRIGTTSLNYKPENSPVRNYLMIIPQNIEWEYTGNDLKSKISEEAWYADSVHGDDKIMAVVAPTMLNANTYTVGFTKKISDYVWSDGSTDTTKTITVTVKKKKLNIEWDSTSGVTEAKIKSGLVNNDKSNPPTITNTYYEMNGNTVGAQLSGRPTAIGTYKVVATLPENSNYRLKEEGEEDPWTIFNLSAIPIATPTVSGSHEKDYDGSELVFTLANAEEMGAKEAGKKIQDEPVEIPTGATYIKDEDGTRKIVIRNVGVYVIKFGLHDETNNCWGEGGGFLRLEVKPRSLTLTPARGGGWENFETNTNEKFTITHNAVDNDIIQYSITYVKPDNTVITVGSDKLKLDEENAKKTTVTLDPLDTGVHKLRIGLAPSSAANANGNYVLSNSDLTEDGFIEREFTVNGKIVNIQDTDIVWQYSDGNIDGEFTSETNLEYNGRRFTVTIKEDQLTAMGVRVKQYVHSDRNDSTNTDIGLNAGKYKTKVVLTKLNDTYDFTDTEFELDWEISKTIFDLSKVKWDYTAPIGYTGKAIKVQLTNVPQLLTATYLGNIETQVNSGTGEYTATVSFKPKNEADKDNYIVPSGDAVQNGVVKYKYDGGESFPWTLKWKIVQGVIDINWDLDGKDVTGAGGYPYSYPTLLGGGENVEYTLYKEVDDGNGNLVRASTATAFNQVAEPAAHERVWYYVVATLKSTSATNFRFGGDGSNPELRFAVGDYRDPVNVTASGGGMYNGKPQPITFTHDILADSDFKVTYLTDEGVALSGAPTNVGKYTARISVVDSKADSYYVVGRSFTFEITQFKINASDLKWDYTTPYQFVRDNNGERMYTVTLDGIPTTLNLVYTNNSFSAAGEYTATVAFDNDSIDDEIRANIDLSVFWNASTQRYEIPSSVNTLQWKIEKHTLTKPTSSSGHTYGDATFKLAELIGLDPDWANYLTLSVKKGTTLLNFDGSDYSVEGAGTYYITCTPIGSLRDSVKWSDGGTVDKTVTVKIDPLYVKVIGWEGKPAVAKFENGEGFSQTMVVYKGNGGREISADEVESTYNEDIIATVVVIPEMEGNVYIDYDDGVEMSCKFRMFQGNATPLERPTLIKDKLEFNFETQTFVIKNWKEIRDYVTILGATSSYDPLTVDGSFIGKRTVKVALRSDLNVAWRGGDPETRLEIVELVIEVVPGTLSQIWEWNEQTGRFELSAIEDYDISKIVEYEYYDMDGMPVNPDKLKNGVKYTAVATIKSDYREYFCFGMKEDGEGGVILVGSSNEREFTFGEGNQPNETETKDPTGGATGDEGDDKTNSLPLWQLIVGGVSAVLFVFCSLKAFGEYGKYKSAKKEVKQLASITYSIGALPLLAVGPFLGMEESSWTIIAFVALGLFLVSAAVLFVMTKKRKGAELALAREKARIADEKEFAREEEQMRREEQMREEQRRRDEEQQRRDNELRMMFAAMQQGGYGQAPFQYEDMQNMITSAVSALLPAMQQMAALPPAQSDPNAYAQPQQGYNGRSEADELRAQMAEQQARMEAQMAEQKELINQLLQNQQAQQQEYEEEPVDDISWLGESDEVISLEESYGALSDEAKRAYYEIGSYIMSKPRTSQNDGRYAVLFKYRRRTLFKLCIKDDAPVLYYPEGSGRGEIRIADAASLGLAKSMIDRTVARLDSELN